MNFTKEAWVERAITGIAVAIAFGGSFAIFGLIVVLANEAPEMVGLIAAASVIAAAIYFRPAGNTYNVQMPHPDAAEIIREIKRLVRTGA